MISFAILTHNEGDCIQRLLDQLINIRDISDEIVIVDDCSQDPVTRRILDNYASEIDNIFVYTKKFNGDFSEQKNYLNTKCSEPWIFNIDADELLSDKLALTIHSILKSNITIEYLKIPRINTVEGITKDDIRKWNWFVDTDNHINYPDYQGRIYKNSPDIYWIGKVHEHIIGYTTHSVIPSNSKEYALIHNKSIDKQRMQNNFYTTI